MILFLVFACLMLLAALCFVLVPLLRMRAEADAADSTKFSDAVSNVAVFRSQKREIEEDFARGVMGAEEREAALNELSQRLVDEVPADAAAGNAAEPARHQRPWLLVGVMGALLPAAAFMIYAALGSPQALRAGGAGGADGSAAMAPHAVAGGAAGAEAQITDKQILAMVDTLSQKMQQNPDDPKGWVLLARSQGALGRYAEAMAAYERATQLLPADAQLFADFADVAVMAQQGRFEGRPLALIQQTLKLDPNSMKGLALAGTAELRLGNREASLKYWGKLKTLVAKDSDDYRQVEAIMAEIQSGKSPVSSAAPGVPAAGSTGTVAATPVQSVKSPVNEAKPAAPAGVAVTGQVMLAPELAAKLAATDTLFIFARAKEGPRMPLAVLRSPVPKPGEFPKTFELTDAMAMAPGLNLSSFPEVVIEARISKSGNAQLQPGDLSGVSDAVKPGARGVKVSISRVAP